MKFFDPHFAESLKQFTRVWNDDKEFNSPIEVSSGRYWYHVHLVLVVDGRYRIRDIKFLGYVFETCQAIGLNRGYLLGGLSVMPDHVHLSLRGKVSDSPEASTIVRHYASRIIENWVTIQLP